MRRGKAKGKTKGRKRRLFFLLAAAAAMAAVSGCTGEKSEEYRVRTVMYLYPQEATEVAVRLEGETPSCTYPAYEEEWNVRARPDGTITDLNGGQEYSCLFREGTEEKGPDLTEGFVIRGEDTASFLQETFSAIGLLPSEYNELIVHWLPRMEDNPWNLIRIRVETGRREGHFHISPEPDCVIRVSMVYRALEKPVAVKKPELENLRQPRRGFTVVEWSGAESAQ